MTLSDEVQTVEEGNAEDNYRIMFGFMPFYPTYDTHCYSERYKSVPYGKDTLHTGLKVNKCLVAPRGSHPKRTTTQDVSEKVFECPYLSSTEVDEHAASQDCST